MGNLFSIDQSLKYDHLYPRQLKMRIGGKQMKPNYIDALCDCAKRAQATRKFKYSGNNLEIEDKNTLSYFFIQAEVK